MKLELRLDNIKKGLELFIRFETKKNVKLFMKMLIVWTPKPKAKKKNKILVFVFSKNNEFFLRVLKENNRIFKYRFLRNFLPKIVYYASEEQYKSRSAFKNFIIQLLHVLCCISADIEITIGTRESFDCLIFRINIFLI